MKRLIYYPTLEPHDINWLKYAMIYIDNFSPIIPKSVESEISDTFKLITDSTDLISIHNPTYNQGDRASTKTLKELVSIQQFPNQYRDKFNVMNIESVIQNPSNWNYKLYEQKFNMDFRHEIEDRKLGKSIDNGILTSKELGNLFMIFLSEEVAKDERGNPITDITEYDNLTTYLRDIESQQHTEQDDFVKTVLDLRLPEKIETIPLEKIIEFRNSSEILELRKKLNLNITKFYNTLEHGNDPSKYIDYIDTESTEITKEISLFFGGVVACSLGASSILANPLSAESLKDIIEGTIMSFTGITAINSAWSKNADKRAARKFLTKLNRI